ncbi:phage virion morphogenesis protein [Veronia pacifica]|uniref:Phage virion morphogenesis protein n=1 Tax=Veronia pacifica TaxID=1080227 RepID=A0A1C3EE49_9GAMM|nr:phage virion morphogenesis protein [Veronia pacifica]ODA31516.1 phage virion morphogenesis protein [Veronia pacifica]
MNNFNDIEPWAESILRSIAPKQRKKLFREMALEIRRNQQERMKAQEDPDGKKWAPRKERRDRHGRVQRKKKMMMGLRKAKRLKAQSTPDGLAVGYEGRDARIAKVHHFGLRDKAPRLHSIKYQTRRIIDNNNDYIILFLKLLKTDK